MKVLLLWAHRYYYHLSLDMRTQLQVTKPKNSCHQGGNLPAATEPKVQIADNDILCHAIYQGKPRSKMGKLFIYILIFSLSRQPVLFCKTHHLDDVYIKRNMICNLQCKKVSDRKYMEKDIAV